MLVRVGEKLFVEADDVIACTINPQNRFVIVMRNGTNFIFEEDLATTAATEINAKFEEVSNRINLRKSSHHMYSRN